ncbi:MAG: 5-formyltetrahydrofolate cyclo-ligase [Chlamydiia bacterium]|nr:5-formyltetrahydrofolate cyclo-ligase [Chlamydiia bacterium]
MKTVSLLSVEKEALRRELQRMRQGLSPERRLEAKLKVFDEIYPRLEGFSRVLSFFSFGSEVDLSALNERLCADGRLLLPRVEGEDLGIYEVRNLQSDLTKSSMGILEPIPKHCLKVELKEIEVLLAAGLGFDAQGHRLGYGRGYYDRLIDKCPTALTLGVGYQEQLLPYDLPKTLHDRPVEELWLV